MIENMIRYLLGLPRNPSLKERVIALELAVVKLCDVFVAQVGRIDGNTKIMDQNMKNMAQALVNSSRPFTGYSDQSPN
jgi:hypothetical protein